MDWTKLLEQSPTIGVLAFIVWMFLRYLNRRDTVLKEISGECHEVTRGITTALSELRVEIAKMNGR